MMVPIKSFYLLYITSLIVTISSSGVNFGCHNTEILQNIMNTDELEYDYIGDIKIYHDVNISSIVTVQNNNYEKVYIDVTLEYEDDETIFIIFTTEHFKNYFKEQSSNQIIVNVDFECPDGSKRVLLFYQPIKEGNYFRPEFDKDSYVFVVPTPLFNGIELTIFEEISATDNDVIGNNITFSSNLDSEELDILFGVLDKRNKTTFASLKLQSILLSLTENIVFFITATDNGKPPLSSYPAKVTIKIDTTNSMPPVPSFTKAIMYGRLTEDLELEQLKLILKPETYSKDVSFTKLMDDDDIFKIRNSGNVVYVSLVKQLERNFLEGKEMLTLIVEATNAKLKETGRTAVSVLIPKPKDFRFKKEFYKGQLVVKTNSVEMENLEIVPDEKTINTIEVELEGEFRLAFDIDKYQRYFTLTLKPGTTPKLWSNVTYISLKLKAKLDLEEIASTNILIDVVHTTLWFDKSVYIGSIDLEDYLVLDPIQLYTSEETTDDVKIQLLQEDANLFSFEKNGIEIRLKLKENIQSELESKSLFRIDIEAEESKTGVRNVCVVLIGRSLKPAEEKEYRFKEGLYKGELMAKQNSLTIEDFEFFTNTDELYEINFELEGKLAQSFTIKRRENIISLDLKDDIIPSFWFNISYVSLKLIAKLNSNEIVTTVIIIDVVHTTLSFGKLIYFGSIGLDGSLDLEHIQLYTSEDTAGDIKIQLLQVDANFFSFDRIGSEVILKLRQDIEIDLENKTLLQLGIEAEEKTTRVKAACVVIIERTIKEKVYQFKTEVYNGKLVAKNNSLDIGDIEFITNTNDLFAIDFEIEGQYLSLFNVDQLQNFITLTVDPDVIPSVWKNISYISLKLLARMDQDIIATTSVIIDVIHTILCFDKSTYFGSIGLDDILVLDPIQLYTNQDSIDNIKIQLLQMEADIFLADKIGSEIKLRLKENFQSKLENKTLLQLDIEAKEEETGVWTKCTVVIKKTIENNEFHFKEVLYRGKLIARTNSLDIDNVEVLTSMNVNDIDIELEGVLKNSFVINHDQNIIKLSLEPHISSNIWKNITYVSLKLLAKVELEEIAATTILIDVVHMTLWFDKSMYLGSISSDDILAMESVKLNSNEEHFDADDIQVQVIQSDDNIFTFDKIENEIRLKVNENIHSKLENKTMIRLEIEAQEMVTGAKALCVVLITREVQNKEYHFNEGLFKGILFAKTRSLKIDDIKFLTNTNDIDVIEFDLEGQFKESFNLKRNENVIQLSLKEDLNPTKWKNISHISFKLSAILISKEIASTVLVIDIVYTTLWFEKLIYFGTINTNNSLTMDTIKLYTNEYSTENVKIHTLLTDADLFVFEKIGNEINFTLKENVDNGLENKTLFRFEVEAEEEVMAVKAVCVVLIGKAIEEKVMKFEQHFYESEIIGQSDILCHIGLVRESYVEDTIITISGQYADLFNTTQTQNRLSISLNKSFNLNDFYNVSYLYVEAKASSMKKKVDAWTVIVFKLVQDPAPEFEEHVYVGAITKLNTLQIPKLIVKRSTWKTSTSVEIVGNYSKYFESNFTENKLEIFLKLELSDDLKMQNYIVLLIVASNGHSKGYTTLVVNLPLIRSVSNLFKKMIQSGKLTANDTVQVLEMPDIEFVDEYNVADFSCKMTGDEAIYFDYSVVSPKNVIKINLNSKVPEELMLKQFYIIISLQCQQKKNELKTGSTILFVTLPGASGCPSPNLPTYLPEFPKPFYNFYAKPTFVGLLQRVHAVIRESDDDIRYFLDISNEHLRPRLDIDSKTGEIFITAIISAGTYVFEIGAENVFTQSKSKVNCKLDIESIIQCEDHAVVSNSLLVKYLKEEADYDNILNTSVGDCRFKIFSMTPNNQEFLYIDHVSGALRMKPVDREMLIFEEMIVPQIEVKLKLSCQEDDGSFTTDTQRSMSYQAMSDENSVLHQNVSFLCGQDILFAKDVTFLRIILIDINDNQPEFIYPKRKALVVGFPRDENLMDLFSDSIVQVVATDKDQGINQAIRYSIQANRHFQIDQITGKIYPHANAMAGINEVDIIVYATDRNGESDGLSANFTLTVKILKSDHLVLLTLEKHSIESVETLLERASNETGLDFLLIRYATVSYVNESEAVHHRDFDTQSNKLIIKLWVYAFKDNVAVSNKIIKESLLKRVDDLYITVQTVEEVFAGDEAMLIQECSYNVSSFISGLTVLAVIVVICIGFLAWKYIRPLIKRKNDKFESKSSEKTNSNLNFKKSVDIKTLSPPQLVSNMVHEPSNYSRKDSMRILGTTTQESTDRVKKFGQNESGSVSELSYDTESEFSYESSNDSLKPRATVTFNDLVQRIHIDDDHKITC